MDAACSSKWIAIFYESTKYSEDKFIEENLYFMLFGCSLNQRYNKMGQTSLCLSPYTTV
jgi:hypothetical protein